MRIDVLSLFPDYFKGPFDVSIVKRARDLGLIEINLVDIRSFATDKHAKVDDRPYGGGPGMVLKPEPACHAVRSVKQEESYVVYLSPQGNRLDAPKCQALAMKKHLILLCGHYEGVDQRIVEKEVDEEISIGDYVLTDGCLAAMVVVNATIRFIPGVLGNQESAGQESFQERLFDAPHYTRPAVFEGMEVPEVLTTGNHQKIKAWRTAMALEKTKRVRPDLRE